MANVIDIVVPDGVSGAAVVEIMGQVGAELAADESLLAIETDKATAEVPSPARGKLLSLSVELGATVSSGDVIGQLELAAGSGVEAGPEASIAAGTASTAAAATPTTVMDIVVPDGVSGAAVVEIMGQVGAELAADESLLAIETDKATAEVPSPARGKLLSLSVELGATVSSGDVIGQLELAASSGIETGAAGTASPAAAATPATVMDIVVPDGVSGAAVVEIMGQVGAELVADESLLAIETDKATAEVPSPARGKLLSLSVELGATVSSGDIIGQLELAASSGIETGAAGTASPAATATPTTSSSASPKPEPPEPVDSAPTPVAAESAVLTNAQRLGASVHASPSVRQFARELGVDLGLISQPSGPKGRVTFADVKGFVKAVMKGTPSAVAANGFGIPPIELPDFGQFGPTEEQALSKIKQITGAHLHKGWLNIPMVTHFEEADITELENFRQDLNKRAATVKGDRPKATPLAFIVKAVVKALEQFPQVNSSLSSDGKSLILKKYYNIGIAVDTPRGLLVPVIKNAQRLSLDEISAYIKELGSKGRAAKLGPNDMEGASFTISSLGGLGGSNFTPLVNPPEAAIMGVAKSAMKPVWNGREFVPRLILPFSISYDHRVLDGGEVARFGSTLAGYLNDLRLILV